MNTLAVTNVKDSTQEPYSQNSTYSENQKKSQSTLKSGLGSTGYPLEASTTSYFESRIRHNFSDIRIHDDNKAAKSHKIQSDFNTLPQDNKNISHLQQTVRNQAIQGMIKSGIIQPKLKISHLNDPYEREADRIDKQIMKMSGSYEDETQIQNNSKNKVQRKGSTYQMNDKKKDEKIKISRKPQSSFINLETSNEIFNQITNTGEGNPLDSSTKQFMGSRFNYDFSDVRIHDDSKANELAGAVSARAFTTGNNIFFGRNESSSNIHLMAHELTHVVQQNSRTNHFPSIQPKLISPTLSQEPAEREADIKAMDVVTSEEEPLQTKKKKNALVSPEKEISSVETLPALVNKTTKENIPEEKKEVKLEEEDLDLKESDKEEEKPTEVSDAEKTPKEEKSPTSSEKDPAFQKVLKNAKKVAKQQKHHEPAEQKAKEAQNAALGPSNEIASQAAGAQIGKMNTQQPMPFDRNSFKTSLLREIERITPKNQKEAKDFKSNTKAASIKNKVVSGVNTGKEAAQKPIKETTKETPDTSVAQPKQVTPLPPTNSGPPPSDIGAKHAAPKPKTESEVSLTAGSQSLDQQMTDTGITEEQLKFEHSNESKFQTALDTKQEAQTHSQESPLVYRQNEQDILNGARANTAASTGKQLLLMHATRQDQFGKISNAQIATKSEDEKKRAEVSVKIENMYKKAKTGVEAHLNKIDGKVNEIFDVGAEDARKEFESYVDKRMDAYTRLRYSGVVGKGRWLKDRWFDLPDEVNAFYVQGRNLYIQKMDAVIDEVATEVETGLNEAKDIVSSGLKEVQTYVDSLPEGLKEVGQKAKDKIQSDFDALSQNIDEKQNQIITSLSQKYVDNLKKVDERITQMKEENKGLISKAKDAIGGVIATIIELKNLLLGVFSKAANAVNKIIKNPIGFLGNLVMGVKKGVQGFLEKAGFYVKQGLMEWLFGALAKAGIQMPKSFDAAGILSLVLQVLGLTYQNIRKRAVTILGEKTVGMLEQASEIFKILITQGPAGLWKFVKEKIGNLKTKVIEGIKNFVIEKIIVAGVTWIVSLLNPASAFVKAAKAIYDIVMFFINRGKQIMSLVNAVIDSVSAIADGAINVAASAVENALGKAVPVAIGFLASLLGLGGISEKIQSIIAKMQRPVEKMIDFVINKAVQMVKAAGNLLGFGKKEKEVKETDPEKALKLKAGLAAIHETERTFLKNNSISRENAEIVATKVKIEHPIFTSIIVKDAEDHWNYEYTASPKVIEAGPIKIPIKPKLDGKDWDRILNAELLDLTDFMNPKGMKLNIDPHFKPPKDKEGRSNLERTKDEVAPILPGGEGVQLHHRDQNFFSPLDEHSAGFHLMVGKDPDFHPFTLDPGYISWRGEVGFFNGKIITLGDIYNSIRRRYWRNRF